jgi:hypothetical protein
MTSSVVDLPIVGRPTLAVTARSRGTDASVRAPVSSPPLVCGTSAATLNLPEITHHLDHCLPKTLTRGTARGMLAMIPQLIRFNASKIRLNASKVKASTILSRAPSMPAAIDVAVRQSSPIATESNTSKDQLARISPRSDDTSIRRPRALIRRF